MTISCRRANSSGSSRVPVPYPGVAWRSHDMLGDLRGGLSTIKWWPMFRSSSYRVQGTPPVCKSLCLGVLAPGRRAETSDWECFAQPVQEGCPRRGSIGHRWYLEQEHTWCVCCSVTYPHWLTRVKNGNCWIAPSMRTEKWASHCMTRWGRIPLVSTPASFSYIILKLHDLRRIHVSARIVLRRPSFIPVAASTMQRQPLYSPVQTTCSFC